MLLKDKIKIIFLDCDYTAYDHNHFMVRPLTIYAMKKLKENGYKICISTSRNLDEMKTIDKRFLELADVICILAGASIIYKDKIVNKAIDEDALIDLITYLENRNITYRYATSNGIGYLNRNDDYVEKLFKDYFHMVPEIKEYDGEEVLQIMYYTFDQNIHYELKLLFPDLVINNMKLNNEVSSKNIDKGSVMKDICDYYSLTFDEVMSFGDSENDESLIRNSGYGVCMANGVDCIKKIADYICEAQDEDGIYKTLVKYGFIEPYIDENKDTFNEIIKGMNSFTNNKEDINKVAKIFKDTITNGGVIQMLGIGLNEEFTQELYYRAGGLVPFHKMSLDEFNTIKQMEERYILDNRDMYLLVSECGNENILIDICKKAKLNNQKIVAIVRKKIENSILDYADEYLMLCNKEDAIRYTIDDTLAQMLSFETYRLLKKDGSIPLIFMSNNNVDAKKHNEEVLANYGKRVHE